MPRQERPLAETDDKLTRFAAGLRQLRDKAGKPTYRELSTRAHYSTSVLADAAGGRRLPSLAVTLAFVRACEGDVEEWEQRWREAAEELSATPRTGTDATAPYAGLAAFEIADAGRFFGRDGLVAELVEQVGKRRFLGVFGASGTGKSSLLRAGLAAKLAHRPVAVLVPGAHPFEACAAALSALSGEPAEGVRADLEAEPEHLHTHVLRALANEPDDVDLVFVVDQFEETFTQCEDPGERERFIAALVSAAQADGSRIRVVLGIRADFYGRCGQYPLLVAALKDAQVMVGAMTTEELRQAVVRPAAAADLSVESALVSRLIADTAGQPAVLPLVSHALLETWRRRSGMALTLAGYEKSGGIQHALARSAEDVYAGLDEEQRAAARNLFLRLVVVGDSTEDSRRRLRPNELDSLGPASGVVLDRFVRARLLTVGRHGVELAHEALIRHWPRLRDWLGEDREGLRIHRQLTEAALDWQRLGRDKEALYRGVRLQAARDWLTGNERAATPVERAFLDSSSAADRRRLRRSRQVIAVLCVLVLVAATTTVVAWKAQRTAADQRNVAVALNIVSRADSLQSTDPVLAAQLRLAAYRLAANADTAGSLLSAFSTPYAGRLDGHGRPVVATAVSADGRLLATGGQDKTARLWDFSSPEHPRELAKIGHEDAVVSLAISPDGRFLATVGELAGKTQLWSIADPAHAALVATIDGEGVTWTGSILTTRNTGVFGAGDQVTLWNVADPRKPVKFAPIPGNGLPVFGPDRRLLAVAPAAGGALLWDVSDPAGPRPLEAPVADPDQVKSVAISVDGKTLATGNGETIRLWDISDPRHRKELTLLPGEGSAAVFGPDGHSLITWSRSDAPRLWDIGDLAHPREVRALEFNEGLVDSVSFSRDGRWAVIAGDEVRLVDLAGFTLDGMRGEMPSVEFSGETLIAGADAKNVKFWNVSDSAHPAAAGSLPMPPKSEVAGVTRSQDGRTAAVQGMSGTTYLWDMTTRPPRQAAELAG
ncbi:nSTAND1 domain-containing NTPase, partial [Amycolatopsis kentuckyensis]|uniref:nSTAND1 domain-containing NTPase n=1 Tax=Amycolatopsis kentuckyensis TaxID=218823 RepID=UPI001178BCB7